MGLLWLLAFVALFYLVTPVLAPDGRVVQKGADNASFTVMVAGKPVVITVTGSTTKTVLDGLSVGDTIERLESQNVDATMIRIAHVAVDPRAIGAFAVLALVLVVFYGLVMTKGQLRGLFIGVDRRYSNSKFQMTVWFIAAAVAYLTTCIVRARYGGLVYAEGIDVPASLLTLSGLSAATGGGAKAATVLNHRAAVQTNVATADQANRAAADQAEIATFVQAVLAEVLPPEFADAARAAIINAVQANPAAPAMAPTKQPAESGRLLYDLTHNDNGQWDFGDIQMLVITLVAISIFGYAVFNDLTMVELTAKASLPDLDPLLVAVFGAGLGGYLAKKILSQPGEG